LKPFATLGSEISKVRDRVRRGAESLHPSRVAPLVRDGVRDQRDKLLAKLGEQTFRLIAERKLVVPKVLQDSVERLAALLGVQLPRPDGNSEPPVIPADPTPPEPSIEASDGAEPVRSKKAEAPKKSPAKKAKSKRTKRS